MSVNAYSQAQPIGQTQFINTYSPIPFQEMMAVAEQYKQGYDQALDRQDKFNEFLITAGQQVIPGSKDAEVYQGLIKGIEGEVDSLSSQDLRDVGVQSRSRSMIRRTMQNPFWANASTNFKLYLANEESRQRLIQDGKWSPYFDEEYKKYVSEFDSSVNKPFMAPVRAYNDDISKIVAQNYIGWDKNLIRKYKDKYGYSYDETTDDVWHSGQLDKTISELMNTQQGIDMIQNYRYNHAEDLKKRPMTDEQIMAQYVIPHAEAFRYNKSEFDWHKYQADRRAEVANRRAGIASGLTTYPVGSSGPSDKSGVAASNKTYIKNAKDNESIKESNYGMVSDMKSQGVIGQTNDGNEYNENQERHDVLYNDAISSIASDGNFIHRYSNIANKLHSKFSKNTISDDLKGLGIEDPGSFISEFTDKYVNWRSWGADIDESIKRSLGEMDSYKEPDGGLFSGTNMSLNLSLGILARSGIEKDLKKAASWKDGSSASLQRDEYKRISNLEDVTTYLKLELNPMSVANTKKGEAQAKALNTFPKQIVKYAKDSDNWLFKPAGEDEWSRIRKPNGEGLDDKFLKDDKDDPNFKDIAWTIDTPAQGGIIAPSYIFGTDPKGNQFKIKWSELPQEYKEELFGIMADTAATSNNPTSTYAYQNMILSEMYDGMSLNKIASEIGKFYGTKPSVSWERGKDGHIYTIKIPGVTDQKAMNPFSAITLLIKSLSQATGKEYPPNQDPMSVFLSNMTMVKNAAINQAYADLDEEEYTE